MLWVHLLWALAFSRELLTRTAWVGIKHLQNRTMFAQPDWRTWVYDISISAFQFHAEMVTHQLEPIHTGYMSSMIKTGRFDSFRITFICCLGFPDTPPSSVPADQTEHMWKHETDTLVSSHGPPPLSRPLSADLQANSVTLALLLNDWLTNPKIIRLFWKRSPLL